MFLSLYSGGTRRVNEELDLMVIDRIGRRSSITYIPSDSRGSSAPRYFEKFKRYFGYYGVKRFNYFCHDAPFTKKELKEALSADAVFLSGGNTFYFKESLKRAGLDNRLQKFAKRGGALLGLSAGSIILTPDITAAKVGPVRDVNEVGLQDLSGLGLTDFLFVPHYDGEKKTRAAVRRYSATNSKLLVVAAHDGGGVVMSEGKLTLVGPLEIFSRGEMLTRIVRWAS